jgi:lipoprotein-anchoring transpeptidase ErfK/SrfK
MMKYLNHRVLAACITIILASSGEVALAQNCFLWFCPPGWQPGSLSVEAPAQPGEPSLPSAVAPEQQYSSMYAQVDGERFPIPALDMSGIDSSYLRGVVYYYGGEAPGTIVIDPRHHFLYFVLGNGRAIRYGVGVGREGFSWSGVAVVHDKQEWPDWYPPKEMLQRQPDLMKAMSDLQSGIGMPGGLRNPLGARAMYLWQGKKDTLFRIHGTIEPWTIGKNVSSGCIRMINQDVIDLYSRASIGTKVVVLSSGFAAKKSSY